MPPKKDSDAPVYSLPHERQVELLSEALLREYMHKRKFTETLRAFDEENPRGSDTISSRALMSDLMTLKPETQKSMKSDGIETIMEMLCCLRVRRRLEVEDLKKRAAAKPPPTPEKLKKKKRKNRDGSKGGKGKNEKKRITAKEFEEDSSSNSDPPDDDAKHKRREPRGSFGYEDHSGDDSGNDGSLSDHVFNSADKNGPKTQVGKKLARSMMSLLCNDDTLPESFLKQGFVFDDDVDYGLIQWKRGPDGVMAAVQAFVCAFFFKGACMDVRRHQKQCLFRSLMTILYNAQPQARLVCLVDGAINTDNVEADMANLTLRCEFATLQDVESTLRGFVDNWTQPKGSGVFCFLISVLLSRGLKTVAAGCPAGSRLINPEGNCSEVLGKLFMPSEASGSSAPGDDDEFVLGSLALGMGSGGITCGFLTRAHDGTATAVYPTPSFPCVGSRITGGILPGFS
ncbi:unnamed protein product [Trypanosoma congolense IL3000]|uniref:Probable ubiquitin carboxyl-terminal hydrolase MINDY-4 n=1 Tax=Trypanosoma congolense (strain IL3000) TaxID=1068625 RepID=F9W4Z2_TRYCI|nr:unnamed protein product [Trypanosoma congolense IL3000]